MGEGFDGAVAGATGAVGEALVEILEERKFPVRTLHLLASERSEGKRIQFRGSSVMVKRLDQFDFSQAQIGLFSAGGDLSAEFAPKAAAAGCVVIDNTSQFRYEDDVPLVVPEVNPRAIEDFRNRNIIANPNCSTIQMVVALKPLHDAAGIERINVATYQAVSGAGAGGVRELAGQTADLLTVRGPERVPPFVDVLAVDVVLETALIVPDDDRAADAVADHHWIGLRLLGRGNHQPGFGIGRPRGRSHAKTRSEDQ